MVAGKKCTTTIINCLIWYLTLLSLFGLDELGPHVGPYDVGAPKVAHPEHQTELVVSQRDDGVFGEHQCLRPFVGLRDLHKHTANLDRERRERVQKAQIFAITGNAEDY